MDDRKHGFMHIVYCMTSSIIVLSSVIWAINYLSVLGNSVNNTHLVSTLKFAPKESVTEITKQIYEFSAWSQNV